MRGKSRHLRVRVDAVVLLAKPVEDVPDFNAADVAQAACRAVGLSEGAILPGAVVSVTLTTKRSKARDESGDGSDA